MEFYRSAPYIRPDGLHRHFRLDNLEEWSNSLIAIGALKNNSLEIGGIWGELTLDRQELAVGLRFSLRECPYALSWTLSSIRSAELQETSIHFHVNRTQLCSEFHDELLEVMDELAQAVEDILLDREALAHEEGPEPVSCPVYD